MRLGILGGTFNPIHFGHLINAEWIRDKFQLDKVIFIPSKIPVHKKLSASIASEERCHMVSLAISDNNTFELSRIEVDREEPSYTITTVKELLRQYSACSLYLIVGYDSYQEIETWHNYKELLQCVSLIVMNRTVKKRSNRAKSASTEELFFADNPLIDISSTDIRERIREGMSVRYLLPNTVLDYITQIGLYKNE